MLNVAYVALAPFISGSERCLQLMLERAENNGIYPILITPSYSPLKYWCAERDIKHYSIDIASINNNGMLAYMANQIKLLCVLKKERIQIVHSNQIWSFKFLDRAANVLNIKRVCHFRDPIDNGSKWWLPNPPDLSIFISKHIEREFQAVFKANNLIRTVTMLDPVNIEDVKSEAPTINQSQSARKLFNLSDDEFVFGYIGQIAPVKGVVELIQILSRLKTDNWTLLVAGKDPSDGEKYLKACEREISRLGLERHVVFCGFLESTRDFYIACDIITMFSLEEPLGLIPFEAAVFYTPTIANEVGGLRETIVNGKTGYLVDINDQEKAAQSLAQTMHSDLIGLGRNARNYVELMCVPDAYMEKLRMCYEGIEA